MTDYRIVLCETCGSEGRLYGGHPNDPHPRDDGLCPACEGTGGEIIEVQPIEMEDLNRMDNEQTIYDDFAQHGLTLIDAIARLERIGYEPKEAVQLVNEWADHLEASTHEDVTAPDPEGTS